MADIFKGVRSISALLCALVTFAACCFFKISPIIGSRCSFFSLADALTPLTGLGGLGLAALVACTRSGMSIWFLQVPLKALVYHMPGFFASAAWAYPNFLLRVILPLGCMVAFSMHPIGMLAIPYTFYWLIPVVIYFSGKKSIFLQALATTFIAHAVGSVIWLYFKELPVTVWWNLIPVVAAERLLYASLMTSVYYVGSAIYAGIKMYWKKGGHKRNQLHPSSHKAMADIDPSNGSRQNV